MFGTSKQRRQQLTYKKYWNSDQHARQKRMWRPLFLINRTLSQIIKKKCSQYLSWQKAKGTIMRKKTPHSYNSSRIYSHREVTPACSNQNHFPFPPSLLRGNLDFCTLWGAVKNRLAPSYCRRDFTPLSRKKNSWLCFWGFLVYLLARLGRKRRLSYIF